jgi:predicted transcriptional regulator of viral defense system
VYATGHAGLTRDAWAMAAVLFAGPGALLSHRSAAALWGMAKTPPSRAEVTVPRERRQCCAVRFHYGLIAPDEITTHRGIPVTGVRAPSSISPAYSRPRASRPRWPRPRCCA